MEQSEQNEWVRRELLITLKYLASEPDDVIEANGPGCVTCDLFEEYETISSAFLGEHGREIDFNQANQIKALATFMNEMPEDDFVCFDNSMLSRPNWNQVRQMSRDILSSFDVSWDEIPKYVEIEPGVWRRKE